MPGVSGPKTVKGAYGRGEVRLKFVPRKKRRIYGLFVYVFAFGAYIFRHVWNNNPYIRDFYLLPYIMRPLLGSTLNLLMRWRDRRQHAAILSLESSLNLSYDKKNVADISCVGKDLQDCLFVQGFVHAKDRIYQMDRSRRTAYGTMAELYGKGHVDDDIFYRSFNIKQLSGEDFSAMSSYQQSCLRSYADGVNAYLDTIQADRMNNEQSFFSMKWLDYLVHGVDQLDLLPWTPADSLAVMRLLFIKWSYQEIPILPHDDHIFSDGHIIPSYSSFAVLLSGDRTADRSAILLSSILGDESLDSAWHEEHITCSSMESFVDDQNDNPDTILIQGLTVPGIPMALIGRNNHLTWSISLSAISASSNLMQLDFPYSNPSYDEFARLIYCPNRCIEEAAPTDQASTYRASMRHESIFYRHKNGTISETAFSYIDTIHGTIVRYDTPSHTRYAFHAPSLTQRIDLSMFLQLAEAKSFDHVLAAASSFKAAPILLSYADIHGNIGLVNLTSDDASSLETSSIFNPSQGYLIISNPTKSLTAQHFISDLLECKDMSVGAISAMMMNTTSASGKIYSSAIQYALSLDFIKSYEMSCASEEASQGVCQKLKAIPSMSQQFIINLLQAFDGDYKADAKAPIYLELFRVELSRLLDAASFYDHLLTSPLLASNHQSYVE
jgi:hypothetical protein